MKSLFRLFKRKPKQMSFDEFVEKAQKIVPIEYSVCFRFEKWRHSHIFKANYPTSYGISILKNRSCEIFETDCPKETLSKLQNYFDTL